MILDSIVAQRRLDLLTQKQHVLESELDERINHLSDFPAHRFKSAIRRKSGESLRIIAEVKKASPSKGIIRPDFDPVSIAKTYTSLGVDAISVLTEEKHFLGSLSYLYDISQQTPTPLIRKDFIVDSYQIKEALLNGASAVLLIAAILTKAQLKEYIQLCDEYQLDYILEVHDEDDWEKACSVNPAIIGVNNRNLKTFKVDLKTTEAFFSRKPDGVLFVSESGIHTAADAAYLNDMGVDAVLIGEGLMKTPDIATQFNAIFSVLRGSAS